MGKGNRRLTISRSERLLGSYTTGNHHLTTRTVASELGEEDIWPLVDHFTDPEDQLLNDNSQGEWSSHATVESNISVVTNSRQRIPRGGRHACGLSLAFEDTKASSPRIVHQLRNGDDSVPSPRQMATSAPVNIPDWSKILRVDLVDSMHDMDEGVEEEDDDDSEMVPPHEYLAREYARSRKMSGASMFEGVGRTLKGRDLRRVRDAVWSQTGVDG